MLAIVVPCFDEAPVLPETLRRLSVLLARLANDGLIDPGSCAWLVDDGSRDSTWQIIDEACRKPGAPFRGVKLSRNRGHQVALLAGLMCARGDVLVSIDADLQDDLEAIPAMLRAFEAGHDIVYGVRANRSVDTSFKRSTAHGYYRLLDRLGVEVVFDHADFRLMSRRAVEALRRFPESNVFLRGLVPQLGFPSTIVTYERKGRVAGESKYPLRKMVSLAWQGITSFSDLPLRAITAIGMMVSVMSLALGLWALGVRILSPSAVPGWASILIPMSFISGIQLLCLGIIGEYLAKVFIETKRRPLYLVEQVSPDQIAAPADLQPVGATVAMGAWSATLPDDGRVEDDRSNSGRQPA